jgi:hypothetical protein
MSGIRYTISAREKPLGRGILGFLGKEFPHIALEEIDSVFGFTERSTLYGGRVFRKPELDIDDVIGLYDAGIGVRLPLSNHYIEESEYRQNRWLLEKYHRPGNAVIVTDDDLAKWLRQDFPEYRIEASVLKNINTQREIQAAFDLYDTVVLPMAFSEDLEFLDCIEHKERITLFGNAGCALTCPSKICYPSFSKANKYKGADLHCSRKVKSRDIRGMIDFNLEPLIELGFRRFKLLRGKSGGLSGY